MEAGEEITTVESDEESGTMTVTFEQVIDVVEGGDDTE
jgi:hypothetical protein